MKNTPGSKKTVYVIGPWALRPITGLEMLSSALSSAFAVWLLSVFSTTIRADLPIYVAVGFFYNCAGAAGVRQFSLSGILALVLILFFVRMVLAPLVLGA